MIVFRFGFFVFGEKLKHRSLLQNGFYVILNEVKDLNLLKRQILRSAQNDHCGRWGVLQEGPELLVWPILNDHFLAATTKDEKWMVLVGRPSLAAI